MSNKSLGRHRRARKTRAKVSLLDTHRLTVFRSSKHIYAQVMVSNGSQVVASASTAEVNVKEKNKYGFLVSRVRKHQQLILFLIILIK